MEKKMNMVREEEERRDRITELPSEIKQQILSCLSTRYAFSTMTLSSLWRFTWAILPSFDFGFQFFNQFSRYLVTLPKTHPIRHHIYYTFYDDDNVDDDDNDDDDDYYTDDGCDDDDDDDKYMCREIGQVGYMQLLDQIFQTYTKKKQPFEVITKLSLYVPMLNDPKMTTFASNVAFQWLFLAKHSLEELNLWIDDDLYDAKDPCHDLQSCYRFLESKTLTKLELQGCYLSSKDNAEVQIDLPCLKHICLTSFKVDQKMLDILLAKCVALEILQLYWCKGFKVLSVPGLSKLKEVRVMDIDDLDRVEINATALQSLTLEELKENKCEVHVASNIRTNLVELFMDGCGVTDDFFNAVSEFCRLKTLILRDCPMLKHVKIISNSLQLFHIEACPNLGFIELDASKLFDFKYSNTRGNNIIKLLSKCPMTHASLCLRRSRDATLDQHLWHSKLVALLENFGQSTYVDLTTNSKKNVIIPQELRESFGPPLRGVKDLSLTVPTSLTSRAVLQYLDTLLWLSPRPRTISLYCKDLKSHLTLKLQYEDKIKEGGVCVLKDFRIVRQRGIDDSDSIRNLVEHALKMNDATA